MQVARALERQGHPDQAKVAYSRVLALQPNHPTAQSSLDTLMAKDTQRKIEQQQTANAAMAQNQYVGRSPYFRFNSTQTVTVVQQPATPNAVKSAGYNPSVPPVQTTVPSSHVNLQYHRSVPVQSNPQPAAPQSNNVQYYTAPTNQVIEAYQTEQQAQPVIQTQPVIQYPPVQQEMAAPQEPQMIQPADNAVTPGLFRIQSAPIPPVQNEAPKVPGANENSVLQFQRPWSVQPQASVATPHSETELVSYERTTDIAMPPALEVVEISAAPDNSARALEAPRELSAAEQSIDTTQISNIALRPFFESFHPSLIVKLKAERELHQWPLVGLVADSKVDSLIRSRAAFLLGTLRRDAIETVPVLRAKLNAETDRFMQVDLAEALLKISPKDETALEVLLGCLKESDPRLQMVAAFALRNVETSRKPDVVDQLKVTLKSTDPRLQRQVLLTLAEFGNASATAIPEMETALANADSETREVARISLACIIRSFRQ